MLKKADLTLNAIEHENAGETGSNGG